MFRTAALAVVAFFVIPLAANAHPLGNFTSNHLTRIDVRATAIDLHYVLDDAEIPTFSLLRSLDAHGKPSPAVLNAWAPRHAVEIAPQLLLTAGGTPLALTLAGSASASAARSGGAFDALLHGRFPRRAAAGCTTSSSTAIRRCPARIGWKDVVVVPQREPTRRAARLSERADRLAARSHRGRAHRGGRRRGARVDDVAAAPLFGMHSAGADERSLRRPGAQPFRPAGARRRVAAGDRPRRAARARARPRQDAAGDLAGRRPRDRSASDDPGDRADRRAHDRRADLRRRRAHARALHRARKRSIPGSRCSRESSSRSSARARLAREIAPRRALARSRRTTTITITRTATATITTTTTAASAKPFTRTRT